MINSTISCLFKVIFYIKKKSLSLPSQTKYKCYAFRKPRAASVKCVFEVIALQFLKNCDKWEMFESLNRCVLLLSTAKLNVTVKSHIDIIYCCFITSSAVCGYLSLLHGPVQMHSR